MVSVPSMAQVTWTSCSSSAATTALGSAAGMPSLRDLVPADAVSAGGLAGPAAGATSRAGQGGPTLARQPQPSIWIDSDAIPPQDSATSAIVGLTSCAQRGLPCI